MDHARPTSRRMEVAITRSSKPAQRADARSAAPLRGLVLAVEADAFDPMSDAELAALVEGPLLANAEAADRHIPAVVNP